MEKFTDSGLYSVIQYAFTYLAALGCYILLVAPSILTFVYGNAWYLLAYPVFGLVIMAIDMRGRNDR